MVVLPIISRLCSKSQFYIIESLTQKVSKKTMLIFGIFSIIHYPTIYLIGSPFEKTHFIEVCLRFSIIIVCLPLCFVFYWPKKLTVYIPFYWFVCITFSLPFFATYMFIDYDGLQPWPTKLTVALLWLVLITSWGQFLLSVLCGTILAVFLQYVLFNFNFYESHLSYSDILNSFWIVIIAGIFSLRRETLQRQKLQSLQSLAAAIAHEMRTPLFSINATAHSLKNYLPILIKAYEQLKDSKEKIETISPRHLQFINETPANIAQTTQSAFAVIDMLLVNLKENPLEGNMEICSMLGCIELALKNYSLTKEEKELISVNIENDFYFKGNQNLIIHVLFNLLKNALYYVKSSGKGRLYLWMERDLKMNRLYFKDTGAGISPQKLPYIFDRFYSQTKYGTGIGLSFCKLVMCGIGGDITCVSVEGEFTQFTLSFPIIKER